MFWRLKRWEIRLSNWTGGLVRRFWTEKSAREFAAKFSAQYLYIDLDDLKTHKTWRLKNNPEDIRPPARVVNIDENGRWNIQ